MYIAVSSKGPTLESEVDERFGRCSCFIIIDQLTQEFQVLDNSSQSVGGGAGVSTAQLVASKGVEAVLTGNCGPNAFRVLTAAGIKVVTGVSGIVEKAVEHYRSGKYTSAGMPSVSDHFGMTAPKGRDGGRP